MDALGLFCASIAARDVVKSFLPGLVSVLTVILTPSTQRRRTAKTLIASLRLLGTLLNRVFADASSTTTREEATHATLPAASADPWLTATAAQIKMALANVFKLRQHNRNDVRAALDDLCRIILEDCYGTLQVCLPLVLESAIILQTTSTSSDKKSYLADAVSCNATIAELSQSTIYNWLLSTPQYMLLNDEPRKHRSLQQLTYALRLVMSSGTEWPFLVDTISTTLQEILANVIHLDSNPTVAEINVDLASADTALVSLATPRSSDTMVFPPVLSQRRHQMEVVSHIEDMVCVLATWSGAPTMTKAYLENARGTEGDSRIIEYWLALNLLKNSITQHGYFHERFISENARTDMDELCEDIYTYALELITSKADDGTESDWRLHALALEAIAFHASQSGDNFRTELVDVLYPIVHLAGSRVPQLREHAVTCLNLLARSCGYTDAKDLLVSNVDYLVNAIGTKINTFDVAPQTPQVLLMMIKLCGPTLLPFLDDLVDGIFDAIECFHEYTKLTTLLFTVLGAIIDEGVKVSPLKQPDAPRPSHYKKPIQPASIASVLAMIVAKYPQIRGESSCDDTENMMPPTQEHTSSPDSISTPQTSTPPSHPTTRTYALLHRIAHQTQHHLPSASATLRTALLTLLRTALPHLAAYDDAYLPLVHTLWPVLVARLADPEAYVVAAALDALAALCAGAGDFMAKRIEALWPSLKRLHADLDRRGVSTLSTRVRPPPISGRIGSGVGIVATTTQNDAALTASTGSSTTAAATSMTAAASVRAAYTPTTTTLVRGALTRLLVSLLTHVRVPDALHAQLLERGGMLHAALLDEDEGGGTDVRAALECAGGGVDAVWLVLERARSQRAESGKLREWKRPRRVVDGVEWVPFAM